MAFWILLALFYWEFYWEFFTGPILLCAGCVQALIKKMVPSGGRLVHISHDSLPHYSYHGLLQMYKCGVYAGGWNTALIYHAGTPYCTTVPAPHSIYPNALCLPTGPIGLFAVLWWCACAVSRSRNGLFGTGEEVCTGLPEEVLCAMWSHLEIVLHRP